MTDLSRQVSLAIILIAAFGAHDALAHSSHKPLFVAETGTDTGLCLDERAPCQTIGYALSIAGKGAEIRVAAGSYDIEDARDVFYIVSGTVDVVSGFERREVFQPSEDAVTTLIGVPFQFRDVLEKRGFNVVADRKGIDGAKAAATEKLLDLHEKLKAGAAPAPCTAGMAGILPCHSVDLLGQVPFADLSTVPQAASDVWGFVDLNSGREYAIVGYNIGMAVFDISDPAHPAEVGFVDGQDTTWRDIKVYQFFDSDAKRWHAYAYVTADFPSTDGLVVLDLGGLPHAIRKVDYDSELTSAHNLYATNTDYSTGLALTDSAPLLAIGGSNIGSGEFRAYSLKNPAAPAFVGGASTPDYMHDSTSIVITDSRKDSQCVNAVAFCKVLIDFNESTVDVWDITDPASPERLSRTTYANSGYVHSGWPSEDKQFVFVHDEQDEQRGGLNTTVRVFSLADLTAPLVKVGTWSGPTRAIDHNGFVRGNRYYISNYSRGLTVLDISDPAAPTTAGYLDTHPASDETMFVGAWGTYPFFFSNTVAISDINSGLYLARDRTVDVPEGRFSFGRASVAADETSQAELTVARIGGSTGNVSVGFEILDATTEDADYQAPPGVLSWAAGDTSSKTIGIPLTNDGVAEGTERLFVRLVDPAGGATLGETNVASVYLSDPGAASGIGFFEDTIEIGERGFSTAVVVLQRSGSMLGPASVDFAVTGSASAGSDFDGSTSGTVSWADGDGNPKSLAFDILDDGSAEAAEFFELALSNPTGAAIDGNATAQVSIKDASGINSAPNAVTGGSQTPAAGAEVTLDGRQSSDPDGDELTFLWTQASGPDVALNDANTAVARFTAPSVTLDTMLGFQLAVTDSSGASDTATASVTLTATETSAGTGGGSMSGMLLVGLVIFYGFGRNKFIAGARRRGRSPWQPGTLVPPGLVSRKDAV